MDSDGSSTVPTSSVSMELKLSAAVADSLVDAEGACSPGITEGMSDAAGVELISVKLNVPHQYLHRVLA